MKKLVQPENNKRKLMIIFAALNYARANCDHLNETFEHFCKADDNEEISVDGMTGMYFTEEEFGSIKDEVNEKFSS